jgi:ATP-binding cassette subfamily F protein uup
MQNPNFLILDEPTNDLDIDTLNVLEEFLENYKGCLMMVTHDRYFMDKIVDHLFIFEGEGVIRDFNGNYQDYLEEQENKKAQQTATKTIAQAAPVLPKVEKKTVSFKDKRLYEELTAELETLEKRKQEIEKQLSSAQVETSLIGTLAKELSEITAQIEEKSMRWLELSEIIEGA